MSETIRVLVADDHPVVRDGLKALIATEPNMEVIGEASDGVQAVDRTLMLKPDVLLIDLMMPGKTGIEAIQEIKASDPEARILVLTSFGEEDMLFPAIKAGALGYMLKDSAPDDLLRAIRTVHAGESSLHPSVARTLVSEVSRSANQARTTEPLTAREIEVVGLIARGMSNQEIAAAIVVNERTVGRHVSNILEKLHLANRTQAALYALREGIANLDDG